MARMKAEVLEQFLARPINAVLATRRREQQPYQVPVWFLWQASGTYAAEYPCYPDGEFWVSGTYTRQWCKHVFRDGRVSLCIEGAGPVAGYVAAECEAEPVEPKDTDIWPISTMLARKYVGARGDDDAVEHFVANMRTEPRLLFRLRPLHWRAIDLTVYTGSRADIAYQRSHAGQ